MAYDVHTANVGPCAFTLTGLWLLSAWHDSLNSSLSVPPSSLVIVRLNAVAINWSSVAPGKRSPANCSDGN